MFVVNPDSTLSEHGQAKGKAWARTLRDPISDLLTDELPTHREWDVVLLGFSDHALAEELVRRGWTVEEPETE